MVLDQDRDEQKKLVSLGTNRSQQGNRILASCQAFHSRRRPSNPALIFFYNNGSTFAS
jgi:hypothetical protein